MAQDFKFQDENPITQKKSQQKSAPGIAGLFIKLGIAKTREQANLWLIGITALCFGIILFQQLF